MSNTAAAPIPMGVIPEPLVPDGCSMKGLTYMPLNVDRLKDSRTWLRAKRRPELGFYLMNLWTAAWQALPAGSLEDDDDVLADAAMCEPSRWADVRADVLRGWVRCQSDGRIYHAVVCQLAADVWTTRAAFRASTARARAAKAAKRARGMPAGQGTLELPKVEQNDQESLRVIVDNADSTLESLDSARESNSDTEQSQTFKCEVESKKKGEEPPLTPRTNGRGARLPDHWRPNAESHLFAARLGLNSDEQAIAFHDRQRGTGRRSPDWQAAYRDWCRIAQDRHQPRSIAQKPSRVDGYESYVMRRATEAFGHPAAA